MRPVVKGLTHDHIDGSMAVLDVLEELYVISGIGTGDARFKSPDEIRDYFADVHQNLVEKFAVVTSLLQYYEALDALGYAYGKRRQAEGYKYVEAKFAPQYHLKSGLTLHSATEAMTQGLWRAQRDFGIRILPQLCIGREASPEEGMAIARVALWYDGAVALDLACDEGNHPPEKHLPAYRLTFGSNVKRDCHAGEWVSPEPADSYRVRMLRNVRTAITDLRCHGIGHAIPLIDDAELVKRVAGECVRVSGCPLSNLTTGAIKDVRELGIKSLLANDVCYTLNADDDLFLPPMNEVLTACDEAYDFTEEERKALERNVYVGAFADDINLASWFMD